MRAAARDRGPGKDGRDDDSAGRPKDDSAGRLKDDPAVAVRDTDSGNLPFTGLLLASIVAAGLLLLAVGLALHRRLRGRAG